MSEYIVVGAEPNNTVLKSITKNGYEHEKWLPVREEIVRCRDCKHAHPVFWSERDDVPSDWVDCTGPLVETWDYYDDEPKDNPVRPDGFCAWGERRD